MHTTGWGQIHGSLLHKAMRSTRQTIFPSISDVYLCHASTLFLLVASSVRLLQTDLWRFRSYKSTMYVIFDRFACMKGILNHLWFVPRLLSETERHLNAPGEWYRRHENNGWRLVSDRVIHHLLQTTMDPVTIETGDKRSRFHHSTVILGHILLFKWQRSLCGFWGATVGFFSYSQIQSYVTLYFLPLAESMKCFGLLNVRAKNTKIFCFQCNLMWISVASQNPGILGAHQKTKKNHSVIFHSVCQVLFSTVKYIPPTIQRFFCMNPTTGSSTNGELSPMTMPMVNQLL